MGAATSRRSEGARSSGRGVARVMWLKAVAVVAAVASLTINFGLIDLIDGFTGYVDQERNQVLDVGWGAVFGVVLPLGLLALLRRPETANRRRSADGGRCVGARSSRCPG